MPGSFLVSPGEAALAGGPLVLDVRAAEVFAAGHLPGAVHLDLWGFSLIDTDPAPLAAFLWMVEHVLALRGVSDDRPVIVYGDSSDVRAARVFWFLDYFGHPDVRFLDGGAAAWRDAGLPLTTDAAAPVSTTWHGRPVRERLATWRDVADRIGQPGVVMLDTRTGEEFCGTLVRAARGGCIPGAVHVEWTANVAPDGRFKPAADLRAIYEDAGVTPDKEVVSYCQGAYRAANSYVALRSIGYPRVRNYLGSWKEWSDRGELPVQGPRETGSGD
jgi:thiosulfate/3-mercaptopyruvate sulfurtransferase